MENQLFLAPASTNGSAFEHLRRSVIEGVQISALERKNNWDEDRSARIWGLTSGLKTAWETAESGDWLFFYTGDEHYRYAAQISGKAHNPELGEQIRSEFLHVSNDERRDNKKWEYLLYLLPPVHIDLSGDLLSDWLGYERAYQTRFQRVPAKRMDIIEEKFGSLDALVEEFRD